MIKRGNATLLNQSLLNKDSTHSNCSFSTFTIALALGAVVVPLDAVDVVVPVETPLSEDLATLSLLRLLTALPFLGFKMNLQKQFRRRCEHEA